MADAYHTKLGTIFTQLIVLYIDFISYMTMITEIAQISHGSLRVSSGVCEKKREPKTRNMTTLNGDIKTPNSEIRK